MSRGTKFYREAETPTYKPQSRTQWFDNFAKSILDNKQISNAAKANDVSDYISNIINRKSKNATVADVVNEYQELTGLKKYLNNIYSVKQAQEQIQAPVLFPELSPKVKEKILSFVKNRIEAYKGFVSVLALQEEILNSFKNEGLQPQDVYEQNFSKYLMENIEAEKNKHPNHEDQGLLGKRWQDGESFEDEAANNDFFHNLEPKQTQS